MAPDPLALQHRDQPVVLAGSGNQRLGRMGLNIAEAGQRFRQAHTDFHRQVSKSYSVKRLNRYTVTAPNPLTGPKVYGCLCPRNLESLSA